MKITLVAVECCFNLGNYENQRLRLEAKLEDGDTPEAVADTLKHQIHIMADKEDTYYERNSLAAEIKQLETKVEKARDEWEQSRMFLVAQGLRPDAPPFPIPAAKALPAAASVKTETLETETVEAGSFA